MKTLFVRLALAAVLGSLLISTQSVFAQGTAFTYQGQLQNGASLASGNYDLSFSLYTNSSGGTAIAGPVTNLEVGVTNGLFTTIVSFPDNSFSGGSNWLAIAVSPHASNTFMTLLPRQQLTPTPYAIFAGTASNLSGTVASANLSGTYGDALTLNNAANSFTGNGSGLTSLNASQLTSGTVPDGELPANVALLNGNQSFTGSNSFSGLNASLTISGTGPISTNIFTGLGFQFYNSSGEGAIMSSVNDEAGLLTFYTKPGPGFPPTRQMKIDRYGVLFIDQQNANYGALNDGTTNADGIAFGGNSGEGIASQRTAGVNQNGLDFYTAHTRKMSILDNGNVGIGTTNPGTALQVNGTVTATSFSGNGAGLTNLSAAQLTGFSYVTPPASGGPILNMVWIVPGTFIMGAPTSDPDDEFDETQHVVTLTNGFWMGQHPVTQGEYLAVTGTNPSAFTGDMSRPVEQVTWLDATNYCYLLTQREQSAGRLPAGWVYRLPTESEWEYCCRALTTSRYYFGNDPGDGASLTNYAWYSVNSGSSTQPVGQLLPNAWGLVDMAGNVEEWCQDWYGIYPTANVSYNPQGPASGGGRVERGCGWDEAAPDCRSAARDTGSPGSGAHDLGFRVVLAPGQ
jgi:formylglycine-generating enzyme required for sulfatase activity